MLSTLDLVVLVLYAAGVVVFGLRMGRGQGSAQDYFLGSRDLPWWAVCFSIVATETSTLTVLSVPGIAYGGTLVFLQLTFGYLIGRILVAYILLPRYMEGQMETAYGYLGERFGDRMRGLASVTFLLTRLLADGVRLYATAIPIHVIGEAAGYDLSYATIIVGLGVLTAAYTYAGGLKAVVWMDVVQMGVYVGGGIIALVLLAPAMMDGGLAAAREAGKLLVVDWGAGLPLGEILTSPYVFPVAVLGGAVFACASHGADQLIVQRVLGTRSLTEARKAMIWSGVFVMLQFALFLAVGLGLWAYYGGVPLTELGLTKGDELFPRYILDAMPSGIRGLLLAGIVAAAMSTLSSSLNALAGSTLLDLVERVGGVTLAPARALRLSRILTLVWAGVFMAFATLFIDTDSPVIELGLGIAGFTYGGLLGAFVLGLAVPRARQLDAMIAFLVTVTLMTVLIFGLYWSSEAEAWTFVWKPSAAAKAAQGLRAVAWPLYPLIGVLITLVVGGLLSLRHPPDSVQPPGAVAPPASS